MLITVLLGMYFDAVVVNVTSQALLFRLALAILCNLVMSSSWNFPSRARKVRAELSWSISIFELKPSCQSF